ncbi:MAG TPA: guanylate cyclase, partial [Mycobacterium sp.]|nr:guanylate cyclase [Mycobacterium sp.]
MDANTVTLDRALDETRTGDIWLFRGDSRPDRAIQTMTNAPVNHVGMTVAIDDLPPLMWHAELGDKLQD